MKINKYIENLGLFTRTPIQISFACVGYYGYWFLRFLDAF